jgi:Ca2+-binding EF-hand superfamily protein
MHFEALDLDRSGALEERESEQAGSGADRDGDGRITLLELAGSAGVLGASPDQATDEMGAVSGASQPGSNALAHVLDGTDPYRFDQDRSKGLSRSEAERAVFAALDLDGDEKLTLDELSRMPGAMRELRHRDARALRLFAQVDKSRDEHVSAREFSLEDAEWRALDADGDGAVGLFEPALEFQRQRGFVLPGSEWPSRRIDLLLLPPGIGIDRLLAEFDRDADEILDQRELKARPDLLKVFDQDGSQRVEREELARRLGRLDDEGVHALADDFLGRWDLDGSGVVDPDELSEGVRLRLGMR